MHGLRVKTAVKEHILKKGEGGKCGFPSGRTEDDFDQWMGRRMFDWEKHYGA